jgi:hypothetical protein
MAKALASARQTAPLATYVTTLLGNGEICPIAELIGRRCVRRIDATSAEGRRLLRSGSVTVLTRDGQRFTRTPIVDVLDRLVDEVSREATDPDTDPRAHASLSRLLTDLHRQRRYYS